MKYFAAFVLCGILMVSGAVAQQPQGAHVHHYFPQVADGSGEWQTSFTFINPDDSAYAAVTLRLFSGDGSGLALDFGSGAFDTHAFLIPARGTITKRSTGTLPVLTGGWAFVSSTIPVQAVASYRQSVGGVPKLDVSLYPTLPTIEFFSPASNNHGFAIANVHISEPITVKLEIRDTNGVALGNPVSINIPALGYKSAYLSQYFPGVNFSGTLRITAADTAFPRNDEFVAMTIGSDGVGLWAGLPPGPASRPQPDYDRLWLAYKSLVNAALKSNAIRQAPGMEVLLGNRIDIHIDTEAGLIVATLGVAQLLDSDNELAYAFGHELGHLIQSDKGLVYDPGDSEMDADVWGMILSMLAGYDPYAAAGALGKLSMASGGAGLITESFDDILYPNVSFTYRLGNLYQFFDQVCSRSPGGCGAYRRKFHPNFPAGVPMAPAR